jgi:hypothetical protein
MLFAITASAHEQTRGGLFLGLGLARGSADVSNGVSGIPRESGWGGGLRLGYAPNPKFGLGIETNNWVQVSDVDAQTLSTLIAAVSVFPAEGLVLRGGAGMGAWAGAGGGVSGEVGTGWTIGAGYDFRVTHTFALGPQLDYCGVNLSGGDASFYKIGLGMTWYFIGDR